MLDEAERLFAEFGFEGVSLRQIAAAAGHGNVNGVQYHFGDKPGLIRAIIDRHVPRLHARRQELLEQALAVGKGRDIRTILDCILRPLVETVDTGGRHLYAQFMLQFLLTMRRYEDIVHPEWDFAAGNQPVAAILFQLVPGIPESVTEARMVKLSGMFLTALVGRDNAVAAGLPVEREDAFLAELFTLMEAALCAPLP